MQSYSKINKAILILINFIKVLKVENSEVAQHACVIVIVIIVVFIFIALTTWSHITMASSYYSLTIVVIYAKAGYGGLQS